MKKLLSIILLALFGLLITPAEQSQANPYGGVCCQELDVGCTHPIGLRFADSKWISGVQNCDDQGIGG